MATELESLLIRITGDNSSYVQSLRASEQATRQTATQLAGQTAQTEKAVSQAQAGVGRAYQQAADTARTSAVRQATALAQVAGEQRSAAQVTAAAATAQADAVKRAGAIAESVATPHEVYKKKLSELNGLLGQGVLKQETYARAVKKAREELEAANAKQPKAGFVAKAQAGFADVAASLGKFGLIAAAVMKATKFVAELVQNTAAFRKEMAEAGYAAERTSHQVALVNQARLAALERSDAPLAFRQEQIGSELKQAEKELSARQAEAQAAQEKVLARSFGEQIKKHGPKASIPLVGAAIAAANIANETIFDQQNAKRDEQAAGVAQEAAARAMQLVKDLESKRKQLEEQLKDAVFQQQAGSREAIALARVPEHLRPAEQLARRGAKAEDVEETRKLATTEVATRFAADTEKATRMLRLQRENITANAAELRVLEMELQGVAGAQLEVARAAAEANKYSERNLEIERFNQGLREQIAALGKTAVAAEEATRLAKGFTAAQAAASRALLTQKRGKEVIEQFLTPQQKYIRSMTELNELLKAGAIDQFTYARAAQEARKQLEGQRQELQAIQGAAGGSAEALERFNKFQDAIKFRKPPKVEDVQRIVDAQQAKLNGVQLGGGLQALGGRAVQALPDVVKPVMPLPQPQAAPLPVPQAVQVQQPVPVQQQPAPVMAEANPPTGAADNKLTNEYLKRIAMGVEELVRGSSNVKIGVGLGG